MSDTEDIAELLAMEVAKRAYGSELAWNYEENQLLKEPNEN